MAETVYHAEMIGFLNVVMLAGLTGLALPILVHLLSRRKFEVVPWGAMQFLELGQRTRRRIRIEELLLLLLRLSLIALFVFAVARPWIQAGFLSSWGGRPSRDVVIVIDGSDSMGWEGDATTPHAAARQWAHRYLDQLRSGDTVALLDARDLVRHVVVPSTSELQRIRAALEELPGPAGSSRLAGAVAQAIPLLATGTNLEREVIVLSDGQSRPWMLEDVADWTRVETLRADSTVMPDVWFVDVGNSSRSSRSNVSVGRVELSREVAVPGFTVQVRTTIRQSGGETSRRNVYLEVDGQRLKEKTRQVDLPANGETAVQFDYQFPLEGSHVVTVALDPDHLPGDDRSSAAIVLRDGVSVLLVDGDPQRDPLRRETFYVRSALTPEDGPNPWVRASVVDWTNFTPADLKDRVAVFLCNVPALSNEQTAALREFVVAGGGLVIAPGDRVDAERWNAPAITDSGLLPMRFDAVESEAMMGRSMTVADDSLQQPWLAMFRGDAPQGGFEMSLVRFSQWWRLSPMTAASEHVSEQELSNVTVVARLTNDAPLMVEKRLEQGRVLQLSVPLDDAWSTLPGRRTLAPLLHEIVFYLAGNDGRRNVDVGEPLVMDLPRPENVARYRFVGPGQRVFPAQRGRSERHPQVRLDDTSLPGVYRAERGDSPSHQPQFFVVNSDRGEADLKPLDAGQIEALQTRHQVARVTTMDELRQHSRDVQPRREFWTLLMCAVIGLLVCEVGMTRRLLRRGHEAIRLDVPQSSSQ